MVLFTCFEVIQTREKLVILYLVYIAGPVPTRVIYYLVFCRTRSAYIYVPGMIFYIRELIFVFGSTFCVSVMSCYLSFRFPCPNTIFSAWKYHSHRKCIWSTGAMYIYIYNKAS